MNSQEQALYNKNKTKGLLCMSNGKLAIDYAQKNYSTRLTDGNGDAFRHASWNYGMVIDVGYDFAKSWSDAHENIAFVASRKPGNPSILNIPTYSTPLFFMSPNTFNQYLLVSFSLIHMPKTSL